MDMIIVVCSFLTVMMVRHPVQSTDQCRFGRVCSRCASECDSDLESAAEVVDAETLPTCEKAPEGSRTTKRGAVTTSATGKSTILGVIKKFGQKAVGVSTTFGLQNKSEEEVGLKNMYQRVTGLAPQGSRATTRGKVTASATASAS